MKTKMRQVDDPRETHLGRIVARCAEVARQRVEMETGDKYLANRVWHAVVGVLYDSTAGANMRAVKP